MDKEGVFIPKRFDQVIQLLEDGNWQLSRISGSHHIFTKPGRRCIPVAFHGGVMPKFHARRVLKQAGIVEPHHHDDHTDGEEFEVDEEAAEKVQRDRKKANNTPRGDIVKRNLSFKIDKRLAIDDIPKDEFDAQRQEDLKQGLAERNQERQDILDSIQDLVARGSYAAALEAIDEEKKDYFVGSSDEEFLFLCDILFYKVVALSESGFEANFGSDTQKKNLVDALCLSTRLAKYFPDKREEVREFGENMTTRIFKIYMTEAIKLCGEYSSTEIRHLQGIASTGIASKTEEETYNELENMVAIICYTADICEKVNSAISIPSKSLDCWAFSQTLAPCLRWMLISFDRQDWEKAMKIARAIKVVTQNFREGLHFNERCFSPISFYRCALLSADVLLGISEHVKEMIPIYREAKEKYKWHRLIAVVHHSAVVSKPQPQSIKGALDIVGKIHALIEKSPVESLIIFNGTGRFILDTLVDCVQLIFSALESAIFTSNSNNDDAGWKSAGVLLQGSFKKDQYWPHGSLDAYFLAKHHQQGMLQRVRYDGVRNDTLKLNFLLLWVSKKLDNYTAIRRKHYTAIKRMHPCPEDHEDNFLFINVRYHQLLKARQYLVMLMSMLLGRNEWDAPSLMLQKQAHIVNTDFDAAEWYGKEVPGVEGIPVLPRGSTGDCLSSSEVLAIGLWSFDTIVITYLPVFLARLLVQFEATAYLNSADIQVAWEGTIVNLTFDVMIRLEKKKDFDDLDSEKRITASLLDAYEELLKLRVVEEYSTLPARSRWAKRKAAKYKKLIDRIREKIPRIQDCMKRRFEGLDPLKTILQKVVEGRALVPQNVTQEILQTENESYRRQLVVQAMEYSNRWSRVDVQDMLENMRVLEDASEDATSLLSSVTSGRFPIVRSMNSSEWKQPSSSYYLSEADFGENTNAAIRDFIHVREILKASANLLIPSISARIE